MRQCSLRRFYYMVGILRQQIFLEAGEAYLLLYAAAGLPRIPQIAAASPLH